jgi:flagellar protein FlaI
MLAYLWLLVDSHKSILISGGTASGKTTLLNALCMFIRPEDKIVSIEDTPEIHIDHTNWIQSVARMGYGMVGGASGVSGVSEGASIGNRPGSISLFDLLVAALRQRPEYVIVGEVRGREAFTLFQAISVGHAALATVHAGSIDELLHRIENEPMNIPRVLFKSLDAVVFQGMVMLGTRRVRRVKGITEVLDIERDTGNLLANESYRWNPENDSFQPSPRSFMLERIARDTGKSLDSLLEELRRKENYLKLMERKKLTYYKDVSKAIASYHTDPVVATAELEKRPST